MKDLSECRVLIVDDVKANVDILVHALREDHKLSVALNGEAALRTIEKSPPDLVLLDIVMPEMDGYEVCRRLRAAPETREIPVMFLSSLDEVQNKTQGFEVGGNDYLTKPFEVLEVKARVRSLLKAKAYSDAIKEQIAAELRVAKEIQHGILPADVSERTKDTNLDVCADLESAREVGGDLYEVSRLEDGRVLVAVGDVSGKGIPAAIFMAVTTTLIRSMARMYDRPDEIVRQVNDALIVQNPRGMFVTLICLIADPRDGTVLCANAGHNPPVLVRPGESPSFVLPATGTVVGVLPDVQVECDSLQIAPNESLVFYTDGVTEAFNADRDMFGDKALLDCLGGTNVQSAEEANQRVRDAVRQHVLDHPPSDDLTVLTIRRSR